MTVAGSGMTWQIDNVPSNDEQANLVLSSLPNLTLVTTM
jgi:hypothetical protein